MNEQVDDLEKKMRKVEELMKELCKTMKEASAIIRKAKAKNENGDMRTGGTSLTARLLFDLLECRLDNTQANLLAMYEKLFWGEPTHDYKK